MSAKPKHHGLLARAEKLHAARHDAVLAAAMAAAETDGYQWITRDDIARRAGYAPGSVSAAFGTMIELKRAVLRHAVETRNVRIVAQGLADSHPIVKDAPEDLRQEAARWMLAN